jgi:hypothetical protein
MDFSFLKEWLCVAYSRKLKCKQVAFKSQQNNFLAGSKIITQITLFMKGLEKDLLLN